MVFAQQCYDTRAEAEAFRDGVGTLEDLILDFCGGVFTIHAENVETFTKDGHTFYQVIVTKNEGDEGDETDGD